MLESGVKACACDACDPADWLELSRSSDPLSSEFEDMPRNFIER